jgi:hypothetical protein
MRVGMFMSGARVKIFFWLKFFPGKGVGGSTEDSHKRIKKGKVKSADAIFKKIFCASK